MGRIEVLGSFPGKKALWWGVFILILALLWPGIAHGGPANPELILLEQPNDIEFFARLWGDEWANGTRTADGYTILRDPISGYWEYAEKDPGTGELFSTGLRVGMEDPGLLPPGILPDPLPKPPGAPGTIPGGLGAPPKPGDHRLLVIVVDFTPSVTQGVTEKEFDQHFFTGMGPFTPRSVANYWAVVSYGGIKILPASESYGTAKNGIVFVTLNYANPSCGTSLSDCHRQLTLDAILASDGQAPGTSVLDAVDYALFDDNADGYLDTNELHLYVVIRGYEGSIGGASCGTPSTWAHRWSLDDPAGTVPAPTVDGVVVGHFRGGPLAGPRQGGYMQEGEWHQVCPNTGHKATIGGSSVHEMGHDLGTGLPDLYDTLPNVDMEAYGIGRWGLMGLGNWNAIKGIIAGYNPAWPSAYSRWWLGFIIPTPILVPTTGVSFPEIETPASPPNYGVYLIPNGVYTHWGNGVAGIGEYWLIENRRPPPFTPGQPLDLFDMGLPGEGLLIWHVDETVNGPDPNGREGLAPPGDPRLVVLEQADGGFDLECYNSCNEGDGIDPWNPGPAAGFGPTTVPGSAFYDGTPSGIQIVNISKPGGIMTADVIIPAPDLTLSKTASPDPATAGSPLTYTIALVNNGTADATGVVLTDTLPAGVTFTSALTTQGSCLEAAGIVTCTIGTMTPAGTVTVTIIITPAAAGNLNNTVAVFLNETDSNPADNTVAVATSVKAALVPDDDDDDGFCFIATAAYGSYLDTHVEVLRTVRDRVLKVHPTGRIFIRLYYRVSPPIAGLIAEHEGLRTAARWALSPVVWGIIHPAAVLFLLAAGARFLVFRRTLVREQ